ncbi:MAG: enoyl-CoA hydratase-related protein [Candidatus Glassbacteria bacterium]
MKQDGYRKITIKPHGRAALISFARQEVRNAFDLEMLVELRDALANLRREKNYRVIILTGEGTCFCAGADISWMKKSMDLSLEENLREAEELAHCLYELYSHPLPTIAMVNGPAMGGGIGFVAACDIAVSVEDAFFAFSEVRIGVVPSCIAPYVLKKVGEGVTRQLFLTGEKISTSRAHEIGLVNCIVTGDELDEVVTEYVERIEKGAPGAVTASKKLIESVTGSSLEVAKEYTARLIAEMRVSPEGQEGLRAYLEKRKPSWQSDE